MPEDCSLAELRQLVPSYITEITAGHWYRRMRILRTVMKKAEECAPAQVTARTRMCATKKCECEDGIRHFEVARGNGSRWLSECIVGLFWGTNLPPCWKCVPQNSPTLHLTTISTRSPAQPQSGEFKPSCLKSLPQTQSCVWINDPMEMTVKLSSSYDFRRVRYLWNIYTGSYIAKRTIALPFELKPKTVTVL